MAKKSEKKPKKAANEYQKAAKALKKGRIDGMESGTWALFTLFYALFVAVLSGVAKTYLPEIVYIINLPVDIQLFVWIFGMALWGIISILLQAHYKKD